MINIGNALLKYYPQTGMQNKTIKIPFVLLLLPFLVRFCSQPEANYTLPQQEYVPIPVNFKVAFIADQGLDTNAKAVLLLIKDEGAEMVLHQGDFDYKDNPELWDQQINDILGPDCVYNRPIFQRVNHLTILRTSASVEVTGAILHPCPLLC